MKIIAADDEPLALEMLTDSIKEVLPEAQVVSFLKPSELRAYVRENTCDIAFLDINLRGISGIELGRTLKASNPNINLIFVTGYDTYATDAMTLHASGYVMKPVTPEKIKIELTELRHPVKESQKKLLTIKCFGNFEVYTPNGEVLHFERSKGKEVLAYLIYREGSSCTTREIAAALFEDTEYDKNQRGYVQKIVSSMIRSLKEAGAENIIIKNYNSLAIDPLLVDCDFYNFSNMKSGSKSTYRGEFMAQYSWAEFVSGYLEELFWQKKDTSNEINEKVPR